MHVDPDRLPDDPAFLKRFIGPNCSRPMREKDRQQAKLAGAWMLLLRESVVGRSSERFDPRQATLFDVAAEEAASGARDPGARHIRPG